jgi:ABC-type branched-subunit amino acid transport system permease subunit
VVRTASGERRFTLAHELTHALQFSGVPWLRGHLESLLREYLATIVQWWQYVLGAVYVLTILYLPGGIMGLFKGGKA